jgi:protein-disulfide isomerase/uncharacterized membrane protein
MIIQTLRILSLIGLWLSVLNLYEFLASKAGLEASSFCKAGQSFDCSAVAKSTWSEWFGLPLASWGIIFYTILFLYSFVAGRKNLLSDKIFRSNLFMAGLLSSIFSIFLFVVSHYSVGKLCPLCLGMYLVNFIILFLSYKLLRADGIIESLKLAFKSCLAFPKVVLGFGDNLSLSQKSLARLFVIAFAGLLFFSTVAQDYISERMISPLLAKQQEIEDWQGQPVQELAIDKLQNAFSDHILGKINAKIQVVEFSDFECPGCRRLYSELKKVYPKYQDNLAIIHKNFPLDNSCNSVITEKFHEDACYLANFARCAGEQNKFWEVTDIITTLSSIDRRDSALNPRQELKENVASLGLDQAAIDECIESGRQIEVIKKDIKQALELEIEGTPTVWVNSKKFEGRTAADFEKLFDYILAQPATQDR